MSAKHYASLEAFYCDDEARRRSPEADYGCLWLDDASLNALGVPVWRVSYIQATGEVYALGGHGAEVQVLGMVPPDLDERRPQGKETRWNLRRGSYYRTLDRILEGWSDHCGQPGGLAWVRAQLLSHWGDET